MDGLSYWGQVILLPLLSSSAKHIRNYAKRISFSEITGYLVLVKSANENTDARLRSASQVIFLCEEKFRHPRLILHHRVVLTGLMWF